MNGDRACLAASTGDLVTPLHGPTPAASSGRGQTEFGIADGEGPLPRRADPSSSRSISSQRAPRISPDRQAVRTRNSKPSLPPHGCFGLPHRPDRASHLPVGRRLEVPFDAVLFRQGRSKRFPGRIVHPVALGNGPLHHCADPLPHSPGRRGLAVPDGQEHGHDIGRGDPVHPHPAQLRVDVAAQARLPYRRRDGRFSSSAGTWRIPWWRPARRSGRSGAGRPGDCHPIGPAGGWRRHRSDPQRWKSSIIPRPMGSGVASVNWLIILSRALRPQ